MAKAKEAPKPVPHVYDEEFYTSAEKLIERAQQADKAKATTLIDILALAREAQRQLATHAKVKTLQLMAKLKPYTDQKKAINTQYETAEKLAESKLKEIIEKEGIQILPKESEKGTKLSPIAQHKYAVTRDDLNYGDIPVQYRLPAAQCIDWAKVAAAHEAKDTLPAFVKITTSYVLRTKLPEVDDE
jgi:hypothetical protein